MSDSQAILLSFTVVTIIVTIVVGRVIVALIRRRDEQDQ